jgi:hypothetical protein
MYFKKDLPKLALPPIGHVADLLVDTNGTLYAFMAEQKMGFWRKKKTPPRNPTLNLKNYHLHGTNETDQGTFYMVSQRGLWREHLRISSWNWN